MRYPAIIHKGEEEYGVFMPDFPGVISGGKSVAECLHNLQDAVETVFAHTGQKEFPVSSSLDAVLESQEAVGGAVLLADISPAFLSGKSVRVNLSIPEADLQVIDKLAAAQGLTRSAYMVRASLP